MSSFIFLFMGRSVTRPCRCTAATVTLRIIPFSSLSVTLEFTKSWRVGPILHFRFPQVTTFNKLPLIFQVQMKLWGWLFQEIYCQNLDFDLVFWSVTFISNSLYYKQYASALDHIVAHWCFKTEPNQLKNYDYLGESCCESSSLLLLLNIWNVLILSHS